MLETEPQIIEAYVATGQVRIIARLLVQLGDGSLRAAEASQCASDQGRFWEMRAALYARQADLYATADLDATLVDVARTLELDMPAFESCLSAGTHRDAILAGFQAAEEAGVRSRPVFDIGEQRLIGPRPFAEFARLIDAALAGS